MGRELPPLVLDRPRLRRQQPDFDGIEHGVSPPGLHPGQENPFGNTEGFYPLPPSDPSFALPVIREDPSFK